MKKTIKFFSVRAAMMLLTTVLFALTAQTAWAAEWPEYVTDIIVVGGSESEVNSAKSYNSGYTWCSMDLNKGAGGDYINFGYKKSRTANTNGGYITDIIVIDAEGTNPPSTVTYDGRTYYLCSYDGGSHFESVKGNLNSNCGSGWNIYLYYTKQEYSSTKRAVSSIDVNSTKAGSINCYYKNGNKEEEQIDLNRGISGSSDVYMHLSTATKVNRPYPEPSMASNLVYDGQPKQLISSSYSNSNSGTLYYRVSTTGSYTSTVANVTATTAGTHTVYYYSASSSYGNSSESYAHSKTVTIAKAPNSGVTVSCADIVEGSNALAPQLGGTNLSTGAVTYKYCTTQNGTYSSTVPTEPGTYYVKATVAGDDNYNEFTTEAASFKIIRDWALHNGGDTEADAYVISTTDDLDLLAQRVNSGTNYSGKFFKLANNITYSHTTAWNDATSTENNFTPIGYSWNYSFKGTFDGNGKTVSGIRIKSADGYKGLFGKIKGGATVKNVILSDARIIGEDYCGGIAGSCEQSTITNCWVKSNVCIGNKDYKGGIAGNNYKGTISGCRSEATLTAYSSSNIYYGGIAGYAESSEVSQCVVVGATIPNAGYRGAIVGRNDQSTLTSNYYTACTVLGVANATNVGCNGADADGARQAVAIGAATGVTITPVGTETVYDVSGITAYEGNNGIIYGGQLYAGAGETVRLNIEYTAPEGCTLNGFTDGNGNALADNGDGTYTLTMTSAALTVTPDVTDLWGIADGRDGSTAAKAYLITTPAGLDLLASKVNGGTEYQNTYFELGDDIEYDYTGLAENESNYTAIGSGSGKYFKGKFDGKGHTVSGIRIYMDGTNNQGLFGKITEYAEVKNVTIADARITGYGYVGGIVGWNSYGTIENCHALSTVTVNAVQDEAHHIGGIVGWNNYGTVKGCTSAATVSGSNGSYYVGGIAGSTSGGTTQDCLVLGGTVSGSETVGAITGSRNDGGTLTNNYHTLSGMGGMNGSDRDGARYAYTFSEAVSNMGAAGTTYGTGTYEGITAYENGLYYNGKYYYFSLWGGSGTEADPYVIYNTQGMDLLATNVNGGNDYNGSYFVLGADIAYDKTVENNYTTIGNNLHPFCGTFDGQGHTISGIRISAPDGEYKAIFGMVDGTVKNLVVSDCSMEAYQMISGIVVCLRGTIENCHVGSDVTLTGYSYVGGIAGKNEGGTIKGCTSAATITGTKSKSSGNNAEWLGGIVGYAANPIGITPTLTDNLFTGTISGELREYIGAIVGWNVSNAAILTNNYHTSSGMGGVGNDAEATGTDQAGAQFAYEFPTANGAMGAVVSTYGTGDYTGITAYTEGLAYNGKFYSPLPWTGDGTAEHPFVISTTDGLDKLAIKVNAGTSYSGKYFELGNDITYSYDGLAEGESNFTTIGENGYWFSGTFDGKGHTISGIRITKDGGGFKYSYQGVFGYIRNATVKNVKLADTHITAADHIGGIAGFNSASTIENCHVTNTVTIQSNGNSEIYFGGIAGELHDYNGVDPCVRGCTSAATVSGDTEVGGIVGKLYDGSIIDCLYLGTSVTGTYHIGAIVGHNVNNTLSNNYYTTYGLGGIGSDTGATGSDVAGAQFAYEFPTANGAMGNTGSTYGTGDYTGITAYANGLYYNGKYYCPSLWGGSGTAEDPYIIVNTQGMDKLATDVNGDNYYQNTYFVLANDIIYDANVLTLDLDGDGNNDSNYMPVGKDTSPFSGNFDGQGHTISGIRVNTNGMDYIGVFGSNDGTVKNLTVSDCLFAGSMDVGAIAGLNWGAVENCHVAAYVSVTGESTVGGIVGENDGATDGGFVLGCTSAATLSAKEYAIYFGGIAGYNSGTLTDNLFTGTIDEMPDGSWGIGAITGYNNTERGTLTNNYHTCSNMGGVGNDADATGSDTAGNGAQFAVSNANKPAAIIGTAGTTYGTGSYIGITAYASGLFYNGKYYYHGNIKGDVNGNGEVDIDDAVCILRHLVSKPNDTFIEAAADVNGNNEIDIDDAVMILKFLVGKIDALSRAKTQDTDTDEYDPD